MNQQNQVLSSGRFEKVMIACEEERRRFNEALKKANCPAAILPTAFGDYQVTHVSSDWWYSTTAGRSFCGCNDEKWASLMQQVGVERHPLFQG